MSRPFLFAVALSAPAALLAQAAPAPQSIPRAAFITTMDGEFRKIDTDRDGQISRVEIDKFQRAAALAIVQERRRRLFADLDADRNGQISPSEFAKVPIATPRTDAATLMRFDTGRDGKVSLLEHRTATLANFDRLDTDKDGVVSALERTAGPARR